MDKILAILNIIVFGILFAEAFNVVFIKKSLGVSMEVSNASLARLFLLFSFYIKSSISICDYIEF